MKSEASNLLAAGLGAVLVIVGGFAGYYVGTTSHRCETSVDSRIVSCDTLAHQLADLQAESKRTADLVVANQARESSGLTRLNAMTQALYC